MCKMPRRLDSVGKTELRGQKSRLGSGHRTRVRVLQPTGRGLDLGQGSGPP